MAGEIIIKEGEGKWINFTITRGSTPVDCSPASGENDLLFAIKESEDDATYLWAKSGESFDKTGSVTGELRVNITASESTTLGSGSYKGELKIVLTPDQDVDKSVIIPFEINKSVID
jgi:hypothetical protein